MGYTAWRDWKEVRTYTRFTNVHSMTVRRLDEFQEAISPCPEYSVTCIYIKCGRKFTYDRWIKPNC